MRGPVDELHEANQSCESTTMVMTGCEEAEDRKEKVLFSSRGHWRKQKKTGRLEMMKIIEANEKRKHTEMKHENTPKKYWKKLLSCAAPIL